MSSEEVVLELASQQVIKFLLTQHKFLEKWQMETRQRLEEDEGIDLRKPSTSTSSGFSSSRKSTDTPNPITVAIQTSVAELTSTIQYVVDLFESNVDPRNCFISTSKPRENRQFLNRESGELFDAGLKVEQLKNWTPEDREQRKTQGAQIQTACRRVGLVLKAFGKRFQGQPSVEVTGLLPILHRFCRLFYTLSTEIQRFAANFKTKLDRKLLRIQAKSVETVANEFNLRVLAEVEMIEKHLGKVEKRRNKTPPSFQAPPTFRPPSEASEYGIQTRHQQKMATSIQQVIQKRREDSEDVTMRNERFRRPHPAGSIATSIIPKRRGFLMDDNLQKARQRIARVAPKPRESLNIDKNFKNSAETEEVEVLKSARKMADLVIEDMKKSLNF